MKLTKETLRRIIKEELELSLQEQDINEGFFDSFFGRGEKETVSLPGSQKGESAFLSRPGSIIRNSLIKTQNEDSLEDMVHLFRDQIPSDEIELFNQIIAIIATLKKEHSEYDKILKNYYQWSKLGRRQLSRWWDWVKDPPRLSRATRKTMKAYESLVQIDPEIAEALVKYKPKEVITQNPDFTRRF